jgi:hypothetical protein
MGKITTNNIYKIIDQISMKKIIILLVTIISVAYTQTTKTDSLWSPFKAFTGEWIGKGEGEPGKGYYTASFSFVLGKKYLEIKNRSVYPPKTKEAKEEVHEDIGYISYDYTRKKFVLRQFHIEGFVNQYILESISSDGKTMVFITEQIENIPAGWKAKETFQWIGENEFTETFELAEPGKDFMLYTKTVFKRK